ELLDAGQYVRLAKTFVGSGVGKWQQSSRIEVEIERISQLESALAAGPNIILLDNMNCDLLSQCVAIRDQIAPSVELEASGGVNLSTIGNIAATGVDRISVGALTHSASVHDIGLDWKI
ncbi:MAG: nicotinate-nucleotide diphosphorylase, partial [Pirellula sp.]